MKGAVSLTMVVATITSATTHSLKDLVEKLLEREAYV